MNKHLTYLGSISFYDEKEDGVLKAVVYRIDAIKTITDEEANNLIDLGIFDSYVIPELYEGKTIVEDFSWVLTNIEFNQFRKDVDIENNVFFFREDRIINPETNEKETFEDTICVNDYSLIDIVEICMSYGYSEKQIKKWVSNGEELQLIAQCIFENKK